MVSFADIPVFADVADPMIVRKDGTVTLPLGQVVRASGKSSEELEKEIHDHYVPRFFKQMTVNIMVTTPATHQ
jgi:protein involved in polysaccharide export with SLBB domain